MIQLTITKSNWRRGGKNDPRGGTYGPTLLVSKDGDCCIGFYCLAAGVSREHLQGFRTPQKSHGVPELRADLEGVTPFCQNAFVLNDDGTMDDEIRQSKLIELFALNGVELEFVL